MSRSFGYSRVSTSDQDYQLQVEALIKWGVDERDIYAEKVSGSKRNREALEPILNQLRRGDKLVVWRLDRLARGVAPKKWPTRKVSFSGLFKSMDKEKRHGKTETTNA